MEIMFRLFLFVSAAFLPECVSLMMRAVTPVIQTQLLIAKRDTAVKMKRREFYFRHGSGIVTSPCPTETKVHLGEEGAEASCITDAEQ